MSTLSTTQQNQLRQMFGAWVSFDDMERRIYSHDVAALPKLIKPVVGKATAQAVVQPQNEQQLVELTRWANQHRVCLVPRAKATSGYGGVLPVKGGITVNMTRMNRVRAIDQVTMTARVEPGVVWTELESMLERQGLRLRTYPSSAPSSTVGGWLAQGGIGYGCYEFGCFRHNVVSARVVLPTGQVRTLSGQDLDLVSETEGIMGFITEVTLLVRKAQSDEIRALHFGTVPELAGALKAFLRHDVRLWSVSFTNPTMAQLRNQLPPRLEHGQPVAAHRPDLPEHGYTVMLVVPAERWPAIEPVLDSILKSHGGRQLDGEIADHEWQERFNLMHIKRLGPSLLPSEVVVPLDKLAAALAELESAVKHPLAIEGMVHLFLEGGGNEALVTLLGFIPHDQRRLSYGIAFGLSLTAVRIAKQYGGRPYATGYYFSGEALSTFGDERLRRLQEFKRKMDPAGIMNPRKVIDSSLTSRLLSAALRFEPVVRTAANLFKSPVGERIAGQARRGVPDDVAWYAYACAQCGYCVEDCDQYYGRGWESESPRGRWFFLREYMEGRAQLTPTWVNNFLACTTCEMCNVKCPLELPNEPSWMKMRGEIVSNQDKLTFPPFEIMRACAKKERNIWGAYSKDRAAWLKAELKSRIAPRAKVGFFAGCTASYVESNVAEGAVRLLDAAGVEFTYLGEQEACCGIPILLSGQWDTFEELLRNNLENMRARGVETVVTACPACWLSWKHYYPQWAEKLGIDFEIDAKHYSELAAERLASGALEFTHPIAKTVTWHDSCHMGRAGHIYEPPRRLLKAIPGVNLVEMEHNRETALCCGGVLSLLEDPHGAAVNIGSRRLKEAETTGAEALVASCPCCEVQLSVSAEKTNSPLAIVDLAHLAAEGLGVRLPDQTATTLEQWRTFEAMIDLLKPEQMAAFMSDLLPEMIEAMPQPFRTAMHLVEQAPAGVRDAMLGIMRPMMPPLFPLLLPGMMPKLMPAMLAAMKRAVPMPEHLQEQMPELMPGVMDRLLPKMLPQVIPHFMPRMEAYLRSQREAA